MTVSLVTCRKENLRNFEQCKSEKEISRYLESSEIVWFERIQTSYLNMTNYEDTIVSVPEQIKAKGEKLRPQSTLSMDVYMGVNVFNSWDSILQLTSEKQTFGTIQKVQEQILPRGQGQPLLQRNIILGRQGTIHVRVVKNMTDYVANVGGFTVFAYFFCRGLMLLQPESV